MSPRIRGCPVSVELPAEAVERLRLLNQERERITEQINQFVAGLVLGMGVKPEAVTGVNLDAGTLEVADEMPVDNSDD
jgi:hypothetical protein